jgi:hypothetical protein
MMRRFPSAIAVTTVLSCVLGLAGSSGAVAASSTSMSCVLGNRIQHVIYIQFDNVHIRRDASAVPSDLEQMPNLLNFIESNGVMLDKH